MNYVTKQYYLFSTVQNQ